MGHPIRRSFCFTFYVHFPVALSHQTTQTNIFKQYQNLQNCIKEEIQREKETIDFCHFLIDIETVKGEKRRTKNRLDDKIDISEKKRKTRRCFQKR